MDIGVVLQTNPPAAGVVELARRAELLGFTHVWTFDSHLLWEEPFVIYSRILAETRKVVVGPMVTNPSTRDWTVTASLFATLNEMYGNRTVCGIGRGDSAVRVTNGAPATLATLRDVDPRHPRARERAGGRVQRLDLVLPVGGRQRAGGVGRRLRPEGARTGGGGRGGVHPPARRPGHHRVDGEGGARCGGGGRTRSRCGHDLRGGTRLRVRRRRSRSRPVPLVRRDGGEPRR